MFRTLAALAAVALGCTLASAAPRSADDQKPAKKGKAAAVDKGKAFAALDADGNGQLDKEEFKKGFDKVMEAVAEKAKAKAGDKAKAAGGKRSGKLGDTLAQKAFEKLDADKDGGISKAEFEAGGGFDASALKGLRGKAGKK